MFTEDHLQQFARDGYCVIEQAINEDEIDTLKQAAASIVAEENIATLNEAFYSSSDKRNDNQYFLDSAERIVCFLEEQALHNHERLRETPELCVNKIGHALHQLDPVFANFSYQPRFGDFVRALGIAEAQIRQSMYIFKQPHIGGEVTWHQDAAFFYTRPQSVVAFWFALDDATVENGCLRVAPGGHLGPLREQFCRYPSEGDVIGTRMHRLNATPWPAPQQARPLEVSAGSLVMLHGQLPHYSGANHSAQARHAFTLHVTDGKCDYHPSNWLQPRTLPLQGFASASSSDPS